MNLQERAYLNALAYLGQEETHGNQGFKDPIFQRFMKMVGWQEGWAWCSVFAELCWSKDSYKDKAELYPFIKDHFSANAVKTYENFKNDTSGLFKVDKEPSKGSVVIWEKRKDGEPVKNGVWTLGHAGIVVEVNENRFKSIEGNTNAVRSRNGGQVGLNEWTYNYYGKDGLCLLGFISLS